MSMITLMVGKRKRASSSYRKTPYAKRYKSASRRGTTGYAGVLRASLNKRIRRIENTIETKEGTTTFGATNIPLPHNSIVSLKTDVLASTQGTADNMNNYPQRIGDQISLRGIKIRLYIQNQAQRPRVHYRFMLVRCAKGDVPTRDTLFKGITGNKMIDQYNTERFQMIAQKIVNVTAMGNGAFTTVSATGVPNTDNGATQIGGIATRIVDMWIPGKKVRKNGVIQYENNSSQPKFYDYRLIAMAYDWFGTPQDLNNVGAVSEGFCKIYFRDA